MPKDELGISVYEYRQYATPPYIVSGVRNATNLVHLHPSRLCLPVFIPAESDRKIVKSRETERKLSPTANT